MATRSRLFVGTGLLLSLLALASIDAYVTERALLESVIADLRARASTRSVEEGVRKTGGPDVPAVLREKGFAAQDTDELALLIQVIPSEVAAVQTQVLLKDGDRAGLVSWVDSPQVQVYFLALKEALHGAFSPQVSDLIDEVQQRENHPPRAILSFLDPALSEERIVFVRVRERLYEFHVAAGREAAMFDLLEALTQ